MRLSLLIVVFLFSFNLLAEPDHQADTNSRAEAEESFVAKSCLPDLVKTRVSKILKKPKYSKEDQKRVVELIGSIASSAPAVFEPDVIELMSLIGSKKGEPIPNSVQDMTEVISDIEKIAQVILDRKLGLTKGQVDYFLQILEEGGTRESSLPYLNMASVAELKNQWESQYGLKSSYWKKPLADAFGPSQASLWNQKKSKWGTQLKTALDNIQLLSMSEVGADETLTKLLREVESAVEPSGMVLNINKLFEASQKDEQSHGCLLNGSDRAAKFKAIQTKMRKWNASRIAKAAEAIKPKMSEGFVSTPVAMNLISELQRAEPTSDEFASVLQRILMGFKGDETEASHGDIYSFLTGITGVQFTQAQKDRMKHIFESEMKFAKEDASLDLSKLEASERAQLLKQVEAVKNASGDQIVQTAKTLADFASKVKVDMKGLLSHLTQDSFALDNNKKKHIEEGFKSVVATTDQDLQADTQKASGPSKTEEDRKFKAILAEAQARGWNGVRKLATTPDKQEQTEAEEEGIKKPVRNDTERTHESQTAADFQGLLVGIQGCASCHKAEKGEPGLAKLDLGNNWKDPEEGLQKLRKLLQIAGDLREDPEFAKTMWNNSITQIENAKTIIDDKEKLAENFELFMKTGKTNLHEAAENVVPGPAEDLSNTEQEAKTHIPEGAQKLSTISQATTACMSCHDNGEAPKFQGNSAAEKLADLRNKTVLKKKLTKMLGFAADKGLTDPIQIEALKSYLANGILVDDNGKVVVTTEDKGLTPPDWSAKPQYELPTFVNQNGQLVQNSNPGVAYPEGWAEPRVVIVKADADIASRFGLQEGKKYYLLSDSEGNLSALANRQPVSAAALGLAGKEQFAFSDGSFRQLGSSGAVGTSRRAGAPQRRVRMFRPFRGGFGLFRRRFR